MTNGMRQQKGIQAKDQQRDMTAKIRSLLNDKTACKNSFGAVTPVVGDPPTAPTVTTINDKLNVGTFSIGDLDQTKLLKIEKIRISNWVPEAANPAQGSVDLLIDFSKTGETGTAKFIAPDTITLRAKRIVGGNITECFSIGVQSGGFWQASPLDTSNIYYAGGRVGIGTENPAAQFNVAKENEYAVVLASTFKNNGPYHPAYMGLAARGTLALPGYPLSGDVLSSFIGRDGIDGLNNVTYGGSGIYMHATEDISAASKGSNIKFVTTANGTNIAMDRVMIDSSGNVGIGTMAPGAMLDVAGGIRPFAAIPDTLCSPLGSQAYNSTTGAPLYCSDLGKWTGGAGTIKTMEKRAGPFNTYAGGDSLACDAGWVMTSCRAEIDTSDGQSLHIRNRFVVDQDSITGNVIGCHTPIRITASDRLMYDGGDTFIIVIMCVK